MSRPALVKMTVLDGEQAEQAQHDAGRHQIPATHMQVGVSLERAPCAPAAAAPSPASSPALPGPPPAAASAAPSTTAPAGAAVAAGKPPSLSSLESSSEVSAAAGAGTPASAPLSSPPSLLEAAPFAGLQGGLDQRCFESDKNFTVGAAAFNQLRRHTW